MTDAATLPYRRNVGAMLFNVQGRILIGRRTDQPGAGGPLDGGVWQCPQGGIDADEDPEEAVLRELREEIGTDRAVIMGARPDWLTYDLPAALIGRALGGRYRGQTQKWFALRFTGQDSDIRLDDQQPPEFDAWQWIDLPSLPERNVGFKRDIYRTLVRDFARFSQPA
ncbi:RNA pyrophosphohydrolase [Gluconacetobacter diazotrophicus]|uniref:RNA pyrophosphohydrolase n=1 Tax=Gluconacetobacter diazotrophicus TaxID=33996 RepID=A0A7W4I3W4_GLUDI|nr:RNA pyrophosphohydrolase [Gluconacetobacter diazotrophicus]MBB2155508.1 RNA pyrophosphohydrolase [Gluconacetobacter diazotrophicus]